MLEIRRLNRDNSWWINLNSNKVLIDPWLLGAEVDYFPWFNKQWHRTPPLALEELPEYDFCLITQKYPDHFHKETLKLIQPGNIVGPKSISKATKKILSNSVFYPFEKRLENVFNSALNIHHLPTSRKIDPIYDALILEDGNQSVFIATHGFALRQEHEALIESLPDFELLITPFNRYKLPVVLGGEVSPGLTSVEKLIEKIKPKYVVATHDEDKHAKGLVSRFAKIDWSPSALQLKENPIIGEKYLDIQDYQIRKL